MQRWMKVIVRPCTVPVVLAVLAGGVRAAVLHVPAQFPTIQAAIAAAVAGDEILVAPGTYAERLDFLGKAIAVRSSGGAAFTTIDAGGAGSTVMFVAGETATSVLQGFTITGGTGSPEPLPFGPKGLAGGGVLVFAAGPTLVDLLITGNTAQRGGGVMIEQSGLPLTTRLQGCTIAGNTATGGDYGDGGGGIDVYFGAVELDGCTLQDNVAARNGGGLHNFRGRSSLAHCTVSGNVAAGGGGVLTFNSPGDFGLLLLKDCLFEGNHATVAGGGLNTSLQVDGFSLSATQADACRFLGNTAPLGAAVWATGDAPTVRLNSCLVAGSGPAGAAAVALNPNGILDGCTVVDNLGPGVVGTVSSFLRSSIVRGNGGAQVAGLPVTWSDIEGGWPGTGNVDLDPLFVDAAAGNYHLLAVSPCRDKGSTVVLGTLDIDGEARVQGGRIDLGCDELAPFAGFQDLGFALAGVAGAPVLSGSGSLLAGQPVTVSLAHAKPNGLVTLVLGGSLLVAPFKGGTLVPAVDMLPGLVTDASGAFTLSGNWPPGLPSGFTVFMQAWMQDASAPAGFSASNALAAGTP